jgi:hypothetical protein
MLEWDEVTRHWWCYDKERVAMIHRASGEAIIYRGALPESGWHRFDYEHDDGAYPLAVQMKRVAYPNPQPERWNLPPWNEGDTPTLRPWIWRIDHERSVSLCQTDGKLPEKYPSYWLWCRADIAMTDAALVWPRNTPVGEPAEEVAVNAGWAQGTWTTALYRRFYWWQPLKMTGYRPWSEPHALPLSDHFLTPKDALPSQWIFADGPVIDGFGNELPECGKVMLDAVNGFRIAKHTGPELYHGASQSRVNALVTLWRGLYVTTGIACSTGLALASTYLSQVIPSAKWYSSPSTFGALGWIRGSRNPDLESLLGKPVVASDCYFEKPTSWQFNSTIIDRVVSSYQLWRTMFDAYASALPHCPGFDGDAADVQGDVGTVVISNGFVAGILPMVSEVRLHLRVSSDPPDFDWHRFF